MNHPAPTLRPKARTHRQRPHPVSAFCGTLLCACLSLAAGRLSPATAADVRLVEAGEQAGLTFRHTFGDGSMTSILEATGSGCAFLDYDGDGILDIYLVSGCYLPGISSESSAWKDRKATNSLFRGRKDGTFQDVTTESGTGDGRYGMAVVTADFDNDGDTDIYVTNYGRNTLYRNQGDGTFEDVTEEAGVGCRLWSVGAVFFDHDGDADLDLFVGNYLEFDPALKPAGPDRLFAGPLSYKGQKDVLYRNNGDGTFTDVAAEAGVAAEGRAMGVIAADYDDDGDVDLYVANDAMENYLYRNEGNGTFTDTGLESGTAFSVDGDSSASMGGEFADFDRDGDLDLLVPDIRNNNLYRNLGDGFFEDVTGVTGIAEISRQYTSWGGCFLDFDNDADLDIFISNGSEFGIGVQENLVLENVPGKRSPRAFRNAREQMGPALLEKNLARGCAMGDYDNDGDMDVLVMCLDQPARLLRNEGGSRSHWIKIRLRGTQSNRDGIGARVKVRTGDVVQTDERKSAASYLSQNDPRLHFGLGESAKVDEVVVRWPSGAVQTRRDLPVDQVVLFEEPEAE